MQQIEIDFEVFKELTARRAHEGHTYNEVIRDLLGLPKQLGRQMSDALTPLLNIGAAKGFALRGGVLPEGTKLKVIYKNKEFHAEISNGRWVDEDGQEHSSPSAAARAITNTTVNGLRFWLAKRPSDVTWTKLDTMLAK